MTTREPADQRSSDDFGAAGHLAAIDGMYRDAVAQIALLAQSWGRGEQAPAQAGMPRQAAPLAATPR